MWYFRPQGNFSFVLIRIRHADHLRPTSAENVFQPYFRFQFHLLILNTHVNTNQVYG
jgi:hypothetical protein